MKTKWKAALLLLAVFLLGALSGGGVAFAYARHEAAEMLGSGPPDFRVRRFLRALSRELDLMDEQEVSIRKIMESQGPVREKLQRELFENCGAPLRKHREEVESQIRAVLSPEQQKRFEEIVEKHHRRFLFEKSRRGHERRGPGR